VTVGSNEYGILATIKGEYWVWSILDYGNDARKVNMLDEH
jgi:hypothetical protein